MVVGRPRRGSGAHPRGEMARSIGILADEAKARTGRPGFKVSLRTSKAYIVKSGVRRHCGLLKYSQTHFEALRSQRAYSISRALKRPGTTKNANPRQLSNFTDSCSEPYFQQAAQSFCTVHGSVAPPHQLRVKKNVGGTDKKT